MSDIKPAVGDRTADDATSVDNPLAILRQARERLVRNLRGIYSASRGLLNLLPGWESSVEGLPESWRAYRAEMGPYVAAIRNNTSGTLTCLGLSALTGHELLLKLGERAISILSTAKCVDPAYIEDMLHERPRFFDRVIFRVQSWQDVRERLTLFNDDFDDWGRLEAHLEREEHDLAAGGSGSTAQDVEGTQTPETTKRRKAKRSTEPGGARFKQIAALTKHHKYADGVCLNLEPIGNNELANLADVDKATASAFFKKEFQGHGRYKSICADAGKLAAAIKLLNGEFSPHLLCGARPPDEDERDEE